MTASRRVEIVTEPDGRGNLFIDGLDLSRYIMGFTVRARAGERVEISLDLLPGMSLSMESGDPVISMVREFLVAQGDCICTEILPKLGSHSGGLDVDPACPQHGRITP